MSNQRIPIWQPSQDRINKSNLSKFLSFLQERKQLHFQSYDELYDWSITDFSAFWQCVWEFGMIIHSAEPTQIVNGNDIRTARWFTNARMNFAENLLRYQGSKTAIIYEAEDSEPTKISYPELKKAVASFAQALIVEGVKKGDRVAALVSNRPEAIIGMLATSSIGAIWSSCSPDFGFEGVLDRFGQIEPKVLIANDSYQYNGKTFDLTGTLQKIEAAIPSLRKIIVLKSNVPVSTTDNQKFIGWHEFFQKTTGDLHFEQLPFDHPLYIMYSSGTTGKPKCIVHGAGGTLIQHYKELVLHTDLKEEDVITYYTTCGWMMWNWLASSLMTGATIYQYDGSPAYPDFNVLFRAIAREGISIFGTSPKFLASCESQGISPRISADLSSLRTILSTGSPLSEDQFEYAYREIKTDIHLASISGGTDIISCFMLGNPNAPVYSGYLQSRGLGMKVETYDESGNSILDQVGELVCTAPFPSRPLYFWKDADGQKYEEAYFTHYPNIWRHGDYVLIDSKTGGCKIYGRSDATLNSGGIRIGTSEIYDVVEAMPEITDSIAVSRKKGSDTEVVLFVVLNENGHFGPELIAKIKSLLRERRSPRHVPTEIHAVSDIPRTISGKKVELAVTKIINGEVVDNTSALANPESLEEYERFRI